MDTFVTMQPYWTNWQVNFKKKGFKKFHNIKIIKKD